MRPCGGVKDRDSNAALFPSPPYGLEIGTENGTDVATLVNQRYCAEDECRSGMLGVVAVGLAFLRAVNAAEADTLRVGVV
jgi:hypothetical protein